jgi:hypothetical protein
MKSIPKLPIKSVPISTIFPILILLPRRTAKYILTIGSTSTAGFDIHGVTIWYE